MYRKYDRETGNIAEETVETREFAQDIQTDIETGSNGKVTETRTDSLGIVENVNIQAESVENCVKNEGINSFWGRFGKYLGVGVSCVIGLLLLYLLLKNRVN